VTASGTRDHPFDLDVLAATLSSAALSDSLDAQGYPNQVLDAGIRPIAGGSVIVGRAATIQVVPTFTDHADPYRGMIESIDSVMPGSIIVIRSGGLATCGLWGELFTAAALSHGVRGTLLDGFSRDTAKIDELKFPVFGLGGRPIDMRTRARFLDRDRPVEIAGVVVHPGELIFGDRDGVVVVPRDVEAAVIAAAMERLGTESAVASELLHGDTMAEVWERHHVL
jgi:4-hydroxy-4-methyl-2-oxoglutarate aldolase